MAKFKDFIQRITGRNKEKEVTVRSIVTDLYGGNIGWFAYNYASNIYSIPEVRTAIETFADIFSTVPRYFERVDKNGNIEYFENSASRVINLKPNKLQNATQFWKNLIINLMLYSNVFVEPTFNKKTGDLEQLYVLPNTSFDFRLEGNTAVVKFPSFSKTYNLEDLIYLNRYPSLTGGKRTDLGLYETVIQALAVQAINVADPKKPRAILQSNAGQSGNLKEKDKSGLIKDLQGNFDKTVNGIVYFDPQWKVTAINWTENDVNRELMKSVINIVYNYFGMTEEMINNKATEIEYQLFVKNKIEPIAKQIEQEFTYKLFSKREIEFGNRLEFDTFYLSVSTLAAKTQFFNVVGRNGAMNIDEMREMIGMPPLPNGYGKRHRVTLDTVNIENADEYQKAKNGNADENIKTEDLKGATSEGGNNGQTESSKSI